MKRWLLVKDNNVTEQFSDLVSKLVPMTENNRNDIPIIKNSEDTIRVLHVDDEPGLADLTADFLERENEDIVVTTETCTQDGLAAIEEAAFDCIVSDYEMPGENGLEFLDTVREEYPDLPFILFTGKGSEAVASDALYRGATDYLQKRSGTEQYELLANRIENAVGQYRAQQEVQRRERQLQTLLENSNDRLSVLDREGRYLFVSPAIERLMGYTPDKLLEQSGFKYVHPDDRKEVQSVFKQIIKDPDTVYSAEYRYRHADGSWRWSETRGKNKLDDPVIQGVVINSRDITARKQHQRELEKTQARFQAFTENTDYAVVTIDDTSQIHFANDAVEDIFGYEPEQLVGESLLKIMPERFHTAHQEAVDRYLHEGERTLDWSWIELPGQRKNGEEVQLGISFGETTVDGNHRFTAVLRDLSDKNQ